jgi:hypothetical protein
MKITTQGEIDSWIKSKSCKNENNCEDKNKCNICVKYEPKKEENS